VAFEVKIAPLAVDDLAAHCSYLDEHSATASARLLQSFEALTVNLPDFPFQHAEWKRGYRRAVLGKILVFYRVDVEAETINIIRCLHGSVDLDAVFDADAHP